MTIKTSWPKKPSGRCFMSALCKGKFVSQKLNCKLILFYTNLPKENSPGLNVLAEILGGSFQKCQDWANSKAICRKVLTSALEMDSARDWFTLFSTLSVTRSQINSLYFLLEPVSCCIYLKHELQITLLSRKLTKVPGKPWNISEIC